MNTCHSLPSIVTDLSNASSSHETKYDVDAEILRVVRTIGYADGTKLGETLQGSIWKVYKPTHDKSAIANTAVVKATRKHLHERSTTVVNGTEFKINENILNEQSILRYLTQNPHCPSSMVQFVSFFPTDLHFYLVMENGGDSFFDFVVQAHQFIASGRLDRSEWNGLVHLLFAQMVECLDYIHSKRVCHFDISLENFVIGGVTVQIVDGHKIAFVKDNIQMKLCDFGLAHLFDERSDFTSMKFCGKKQYQSPEAVRREGPFDAKKNDIWAMGMCLYMMVFGAAPWSVADDTDELFLFVKSYSLTHLLNRWGVASYTNQNVLRLLQSMLQYERDRISLEDIKRYFDKYLN